MNEHVTTAKNKTTKTLKGSVLFTVVSVMLVMVVFLMGTLVLAYSASNRSYASYQTSQTSYTARAGVESILAAMEAEAKNKNGSAPITNAVTNLTQLDDPVAISINLGDSTMSTNSGLVDGSVQMVGTRKIINADGAVESKDVVKISATAVLGQNSSTSSVYLLKDPPTQPTAPDPGKAASSPGFNSGGSANSGTSFNGFGGTSFGIDDLPGIFGGAATRPEYELTNVGTIAGPLTVGGDLIYKTGSGFTGILTEKKQGIVIYGNFDQQMNNLKITQNIGNNMPYEDLPFIYVDQCFDCEKTSIEIGSADAPINLYCGSVKLSGQNKSDIYGDMYLYDKAEITGYNTQNATQYFYYNTMEEMEAFANSVGGTLNVTGTNGDHYQGNVQYVLSTPIIAGGSKLFTNANNGVLKSWTGTLISKQSYSGTGDYVGGNIYTKGYLEIGNGNSTLEISGDIINVDTTDTSEMGISISANKVTLGGALATSGTLTFKKDCQLTAPGGVYVDPTKLVYNGNLTINGVQRSSYDNNYDFINGVNNAATKVQMANAPNGDLYLQSATIESTGTTIRGSVASTPQTDGDGNVTGYSNEYTYTVTTPNSDMGDKAAAWTAYAGWQYCTAVAAQKNLFPVAQEEAVIKGIDYHFYDNNGVHKSTDADYDAAIGTHYYTDSDDAVYQTSLTYTTGEDVYKSYGYTDSVKIQQQLERYTVINDFFQATNAQYDTNGNRVYANSKELTDAEKKSFGCTDNVYTCENGVIKLNGSEVEKKTVDIGGISCDNVVQISSSCTIKGTWQVSESNCIVYITPAAGDIAVVLDNVDWGSAAEAMMVVENSYGNKVNFYVTSNTFDMNKGKIMTTSYFTVYKNGSKLTIVKEPNTEEEKALVPNIFVYCSKNTSTFKMNNNAFISGYIYAPNTELTSMNTATVFSNVDFKTDTNSNAVTVTDGSNQVGVVGSAFFADVKVTNNFSAIYISNDGGGGQGQQSQIEDGNGRVWQILYYSDY